jgi:hypothetical protein
MRSFGVPVEAAARPQPVDRSLSRHRTSAAIKNTPALTAGSLAMSALFSHPFAVAWTIASLSCLTNAGSVR